MKTAVLIGLSRHRIGVDGSGVTTLVAFHGCTLNCKYCLNPQALSPEGVWKRVTPGTISISELLEVELPSVVVNLLYHAKRYCTFVLSV